MTCVVGLIADGVVYIGADSQATGGYTKYQLSPATAKVFRNGDLLIDTCGSVRASNLLRYSLVVPEHHPTDMDDFAYITTRVVEAIRECFKNAGAIATTATNIEGNDDSEFLVGYRGRLYSINSDWSVMETIDPFCAMGSGEEFAFGALHASKGKPAKKRVRIALEAAARFSATCGGPFVIERAS